MGLIGSPVVGCVAQWYRTSKRARGAGLIRTLSIELFFPSVAETY